MDTQWHLPAQTLLGRHLTQGAGLSRAHHVRATQPDNLLNLAYSLNLIMFHVVVLVSGSLTYVNSFSSEFQMPMASRIPLECQLFPTISNI